MKQKSFKSDIEREAVIVMAVQNIGVATINEIIEKISTYDAKITQKQVEKACENLQKRQIFSIDLKEQGSKRYLMRRIGVSVPEIGQIQAIVDARGDESEEIRALIEELESAKKNAKIAPNNYFDVDVVFKTRGRVYGFIPDGNGTQHAHYKDESGKVIFYKKHFRGWLREGLPLANQFNNKITKIYTFNGYTELDGKLPTEDQFKTNIPGTSRGAGRGSARLEYLPEGTLIKTKFRVPGADFTPEKFNKVLALTCESVSFGGCHKMSNAEMIIDDYQVTTKIWDDED